MSKHYFLCGQVIFPNDFALKRTFIPEFTDMKTVGNKKKPLPKILFIYVISVGLNWYRFRINVNFVKLQ